MAFFWRDTSFEATRIRMEGKLECLEEARARYPALLARRLNEWTASELNALADLDAKIDPAQKALEQLFASGEPMPKERALLDAVLRARGALLLELHDRLLGDDPALLPRELFARLLLVRRAIDAPPIYASKHARLTEAGLVIGDRLIPRPLLLELKCACESAPESPDVWTLGSDIPVHEIDGPRLSVLLPIIVELAGLKFDGAPLSPGPIFGGQERDPILHAHVGFLTPAGLFRIPHFGPPAAIARILGGLPANHVHQHLDALARRDGASLSMEELRTGCELRAGTVLRVQWRAAVLEFQFEAEDQERIHALLAGATS